MSKLKVGEKPQYHARIYNRTMRWKPGDYAFSLIWRTSKKTMYGECGYLLALNAFEQLSGFVMHFSSRRVNI